MLEKRIFTKWKAIFLPVVPALSESLTESLNVFASKEIEFSTI